MKVQDILKKKSREVFTIHPDQSLYDASKTLASKNVGALVVIDERGTPVGMISERDIIRQLANRMEAVGALTVGEVMTKKVVIALPDDDLAYLGNTMTNQRIRHLPVMQDGQLAGLVSIGDVVKAQLEYFEGEARMLQQYIGGGYA